MFQKFVPFATANRNLIIHLFQVGYFFWLLFMGVAVWANLSGSPLAYTIYPLGVLLGKIAASIFVLVTLPGILGRLGFKHPFITIGIMFRRHTGISMFLAGLAHGLIVYTLPNIAAGASLFPRFGYELFGIFSLAILTPLFLTSNMYSMKRLGKNWKRVHKLIYVAFWLIVLHIGLQGELGWTLLIGGTGILEVISLVYDWKKTSTLPPPITPPSTTVAPATGISQPVASPPTSV